MHNVNGDWKCMIIWSPIISFGILIIDFLTARFYNIIPFDIILTIEVFPVRHFGPIKIQISFLKEIKIMKKRIIIFAESYWPKMHSKSAFDFIGSIKNWIFLLIFDYLLIRGSKVLIFPKFTKFFLKSLPKGLFRWIHRTISPFQCNLFDVNQALNLWGLTRFTWIHPVFGVDEIKGSDIWFYPQNQLVIIFETAKLFLL